MINYYGVFQLVSVSKEGKNEKGEPYVMFNAAETGMKDNGGHFKFFKMTGKQADYFIKNLRKKENGKYASRKLYLEGYIFSYKKEEIIPLEKTIKALPKELGTVLQPFNVSVKKKVEQEKEMFVVRRFEFADSKESEEETSFYAVDSTMDIEDSVLTPNRSKDSGKKELTNIMDEMQNFCGEQEQNGAFSIESIM